jgi:hypothetical protein
MNERIKELVEKSGIYFGNFESVTVDLDQIEILSQMIVRECAQICKTVNSVKVVNASDDYQEGREMGSLVCMEEIKKHFGVNE